MKEEDYQEMLQPQWGMSQLYMLSSLWWIHSLQVYLKPDMNSGFSNQSSLILLCVAISSVFGKRWVGECSFVGWLVWEPTYEDVSGGAEIWPDQEQLWFKMSKVLDLEAKDYYSSETRYQETRTGTKPVKKTRTLTLLLPLNSCETLDMNFRELQVSTQSNGHQNSLLTSCCEKL